MANNEFEPLPSGEVRIDSNALQNSGASWVQFGKGDESQVVNFYWRSVHHPAASLEQGRPVYRKEAFVEIAPPGERLNIIDRPVMESDKHRWPRQWHAFVNNQQFVPDGTPIAFLFPINPEIAALLKGFGVHTVELCAKLSPAGMDTIGMGAIEWKNKAIDYLEKAKSGVSQHVIDKMKADHQHEMNALKAQLNDVLTKYNQSQAAMLANNPGHVTAQVAHQQAIAAQVVNPPTPPVDWAVPQANMFEEAKPENKSRARIRTAMPKDKVQFED